jgi:hypothetical protein
MNRGGRWRHKARVGSSNNIAAVLLLAMTVAIGAVLWGYRPPLPPSPVVVQYIALGDESEPTWGDPTDCTNTTIYAQCDTIPAFFVVFTSHSPTNIPLYDLSVDMRCNGTSLVNGTLAAMEVVPGTGASPSSNSPKLGSCGTWTPSAVGTTATYFNRLMYFQQVTPGYPTLQNGDQLVVYVHAANFKDRSGNSPDDDYHGAPPWCFTNTASACTIIISYVASPPALVASVPFSELSG